ncbi:sensor histidine kinase [Amycolatopsis benzoatilytica]|uniref:sensor histidine kinase n=1 Tax=Amycolatopsis benzoatilytica TaxID=346045 RepID=UPI00036ACA48|nr:histidine kinase [Amycolatopsis benzoatilytica]
MFARLCGFRAVLARLRTLPPRSQDLLIVASSVASGTVMYLVGLYPLYETGTTDLTPGWLRPTLFAAICFVEVFRRRAPVVALTAGSVLLVADSLFGVSMPILVVFADLLYAATLYGPRRLGRGILPPAALGLAGVLLIGLLFDPDWWVTVIGSFVAVPFAVIPVWWATSIRQHREIADAARTNAEHLAKIGELDRTAAVAAERSRMARDLHDVIAGHLSAIAIQSEAVLTMNSEDPATARRVLVAVRENSVRALEEMRAIIHLLRTDAAEPDETTAPARLADLSKLVESARATGVEVDVDIDAAVAGLPDLPAAVDLTAYRIAQEALTNAVKHAPHSKVRVEISRRDGSLTVEVANKLTRRPGTTGDTGTGLLNMRERAAAVGGTVSAGPSEAGWLVRAILPVVEVNA